MAKDKKFGINWKGEALNIGPGSCPTYGCPLLVQFTISKNRQYYLINIKAQGRSANDSRYGFHLYPINLTVM